MLTLNDDLIRIDGNRLAISGDPEGDWYIGWTPDENSHSAEGTWDEWVRLARAILAENARRPTGMKRSTDQQPHR